MQGIIMAGGKGERLRPLTNHLPKPFLPVAGRPCVEWAIESLKRAGITDIIITTAYKKEILQDHLGDGSRLGVTLTYAEEDPPLGTAGGVKNAEPLIKDRFVVMSGDVLADVDLGSIIDFHESRGATATMALIKVEDPTQFGIVGLDERGLIQRFKEKPKPEEVFSDLTNAGIFVIEKRLLDRIPKDTKFDWSKDIWTHMVGDGLYGIQLDGYWKDIGHPRDLIEANLHQADRIGQHEFGPVEYDNDATVEHSVLMANVTIESPAVVKDSVLLSGVRIGREAVVVDSVVAENALIDDSARIERCVIGPGEHIPAGAHLRDQRVPAPDTE